MAHGRDNTEAQTNLLQTVVAKVEVHRWTTSQPYFQDPLDGDPRVSDPSDVQRFDYVHLRLFRFPDEPHLRPRQEPGQSSAG